MMELNGRKIGERIRLLRTRRGFTQKELAGDQITRNMLSLVENGLSLPSLASLVYLAERLDVPVDYFLSTTEEDEGRYYKMSVIGELKRLYGEEKYRECVQYIQTLSAASVDDEIALIGANAYLHISLRHAASFELRTASLQLKNALDAMQKTVYAAEDMKRAAMFYRDLFTLLPASADLPERMTDLRYASGYVPLEMLLYFGTLRALGKGGQSVISREFARDSHQARHIQALQAIYANRADAGVRVLRELTQDNELPYYMRYRVYTDLEEAAGNTGEYKIAYMAARKKLDLLETAKK